MESENQSENISKNIENTYIYSIEREKQKEKERQIIEKNKIEDGIYETKT